MSIFFCSGAFYTGRQRENVNRFWNFCERAVLCLSGILQETARRLKLHVSTSALRSMCFIYHRWAFLRWRIENYPAKVHENRSLAPKRNAIGWHCQYIADFGSYILLTTIVLFSLLIRGCRRDRNVKLRTKWASKDCFDDRSVEVDCSAIYAAPIKHCKQIVNSQ